MGGGPSAFLSLPPFSFLSLSTNEKNDLGELKKIKKEFEFYLEVEGTMEGI